MRDWPSESTPLSDAQIVRRLRSSDPGRQLVIRPLITSTQIGAVTVDLRLGTEWQVLKTSRFHAVNAADPPERVADLVSAAEEHFRLTVGEEIVLHPGELLLCLTLEYLHLPNDLWGNLDGRSTWARVGLQVHATAGMIDPGFAGYITLELQNTGRLPLVLSPGLRVGQIAFFHVAGVRRPYDSKPAASYAQQTTASTAIASQREHKILNWFRQAEESDESAGAS